MPCDRYPDRPVLALSAVVGEGSLAQGCTHGHPSAFKGETFYCGGTLDPPHRPCPRCGVADIDAPCVGQAEFGGHPLGYRHAGRDPPSAQRRLLE